MMKKAYLDTSALNVFCDKSMTGQEVRGFLADQFFTPVVGAFVTFELAKTFLKDKNIERVKALFLLVKQLNPEYGYQNQELFLMESWKLKYNFPVSPLLDIEKLAELNLRIEAFSKGNIDDLLKDFLESKSKNIKEGRLLWNPKNFDPRIHELFADFSEYKAGFIRGYEINFLKKFLTVTAGIKLHDHHVVKLMENINAYPVIRTHLYHHLHLNFNSDKKVPEKSNIPDNMHLKSAGYFPVFITSDTGHLEYANEINPDIKLIFYDRVKNHLTGI